ncbi:FAD-dependent monooxygenase [Streptosporangium amethystogenes]|uniref:FAD-dependent monooxygenase n=1 Tax=Streptosporangium amethystogenes TaxID=2002 RepID=UPI00378BFC4D
MNVDVIVIGAGPTGLTLAAELGLAGLSTLVVEQMAERSGQSKALGLQPRTAELLELRGLFAPLMERAIERIPGGHFAGMRLDLKALDTRHPYMVGIPQGRVEALLEARVTELGIKIMRGHELTELSQHASGVTARAGELHIHAGYLVGCDGGRSTVRRLLGVDFPGLEGRLAMVVADITLSGAAPSAWELPVMTPSPTGRSYLAPLGDGLHRLLFYGPEQQESPRDAPITPEEVSRALAAEFGPTVKLSGIRWASRFTDASRQVEQYRHGRVLLAGDAAHIHSPMGGQGLNLGVQDAFNLGWKLAVRLRHGGDDELLDTYHRERHPVAARVLANTRAQSVLLEPKEEHLALRGIVAELLRVPAANQVVAGMLAGTDIRYPLPGPVHPLLGMRLADAPVMADGRGLLMTGAGQDTLVNAAAPWSGRIRHVQRGQGEAMFLRPDGYVAWAGSDPAALVTALTMWAGRA